MSDRLLDSDAVLTFPLTGIRLIEASAGTGKTYTIANLYLRHIVEGREVGDVLVVTFTVAATDELRGRIRARLFETLELLERGRETGDDLLSALIGQIRAQGREELTVRRLRLAVRAMDEAAIYTIHGFCQRALTEFAFNSGQQFRVEVLTDDQDLWRRAVQDWWRRTGYPLDPARSRLFVAALGGLGPFHALLQPLLGPQPKRLLPQVPPLDSVLAGLDALAPEVGEIALEWHRDGERPSRILLESKGVSRAQSSPYHPDKLAPALALLDAWLAGDCALPPPNAFAVLTDDGIAKWRLKTPDPALDDPFFARCGQLARGLERLRRDLRVAALTDAAAFARAQVREAKRKVQALSFDDLLTEMREALLRPSGEALAESIRGQFPVAMIDEFQDTDPVQYGIFRRLYLDRPECGLIMIGDPKQAIYSFRGGDIFTYMQAKTDISEQAARSALHVSLPLGGVGCGEAGKSPPPPFSKGGLLRQAPGGALPEPTESGTAAFATIPDQRGAGRMPVEDSGVYTLGTNWRSTPEVVNAVNGVFGQRKSDAFVYADTIPFLPIEAADKDHRYLTRDGERQTALTLWTLPVEHNAKGAEKGLSKEDARTLTHAAVAGEVARLIEGGRQGRVLLGERPLGPKDIAVLVRTSYEATDLRRALAALGVDAVSVGREGVLATDEAAALDTLLQAVLDPRDRALARLALTSPLLGKDYAEVERVTRGEDDWVAWLDGLLQLHETWQRKGFMSMFQRMVRAMGIARALGRGELPERRLTNLLHLGELLQQASKAHAGMDALLSWYRRQREMASGDEAELRLESDAELVQIVTVHASKGLEYPVVFVPYLWGCKPRDTAGLLAFHRNREALLDAGSDSMDVHLRLAEQERLAEDVRLAYVALTRAECALYLVWGRAGSRDGHAGQTALGYLLHPCQDAARLGTELPDAFAGLADLGPDLHRLAGAAGGDIRVEPLPEPAAGVGLPSAEAPPVLAPRPFGGHIATDWRVSSFSALTKDVHSGPAAPREQAEDDAALRFPAGSHVGSYLHLLLEKLDFQGDVEQQVLTHSAQIAPRFGLDHGRWGAAAAVLLGRVVRSPLDSGGLTLASVPAGRRLCELEFDFATNPVDIAALNRLLGEAAGRPVPPLEVETFQGMVTGVIDLVLEHGGRFYIADYKSNFLGGRLADYGREQLAAAVYERRYDLQYLLYTLALHRYLRQRLADYDYGRHFGGVYYLFLRGMRPETGARYGVYFDRPGLALVDALDRQVFDHLEGAA